MAQTYPNWTAYCVDDGSIDNSYEILKAYAEQDDRIKVFHKANGGASSARNYALNQLKDEEWISFVDADDFLSPYMYEAIIKAIQKHSHTDYVRLYCQQTPLRYQDYNNSKWPANANVNTDNMTLLTPEQYFIGGKVGGYTHSLFIKKDIVNKHNIRFSEDMRMLEDQVFSITCATHCHNILLLTSVRNYFYYSENQNSITKTSKNSSSDIIRCVNRVYDAFLNMGNDNVIKNYFYGGYLMQKLDTLCGTIIHNRLRSVKTSLNKDIKLHFLQMPIKTKLKYILSRILLRGKTL